MQKVPLDFKGKIAKLNEFKAKLINCFYRLVHVKMLSDVANSIGYAF